MPRIALCLFAAFLTLGSAAMAQSDLAGYAKSFIESRLDQVNVDDAEKKIYDNWKPSELTLSGDTIAWKGVGYNLKGVDGKFAGRRDNFKYLAKVADLAVPVEYQKASYGSDIFAIRIECFATDCLQATGWRLSGSFNNNDWKQLMDQAGDKPEVREEAYWYVKEERRAKSIAKALTLYLQSNGAKERIF